MVRKMVRTAATALAMTSLLGMTAFASEVENTWNVNHAQTTMTGDSYGVEPTIEVELPGDLAFGINPLKLATDEEGNGKVQIISGQYVVKNYSNVPVAVTASTTAAAGENAEGVNLLAAPTFAANGDLESADKKKNIWLVQLYPETVTVSAEGEVTLAQTGFKGDRTDNETSVAGKTLGSTASEVCFSLDAYVEDGGKMKDTCASGFTFAGAVDPGATFAEGDVTVTTKFTLNTLSENQKTSDYEGLSLNGGTYHSTVVQKATSTP